jgi:hypothetical protein
VSERRTYHLPGVGQTLFTQLCDTLASGRLSVDSVEASCEAERIVVEGDGEALAYVDVLIHDLRRTQRKLRRKVASESRARWLYGGDAERELAEAGEIHFFGPGLVGFRGRALAVFQFFEREFRSLALRHRAEENHYPALLPSEVLRDVGYFGHFPQHVTLCTRFPEDLQLLQDVASKADAAGGALPPDALARLAPPAHVLQPAVCLPCYPHHAGRVLTDAAGFAVTMQNRVYRYEAQNFRSLARLWDFTVRDVVFFADGDTVTRRRAEVMDDAIALCRELDLEASIELANDPFFLDGTRDKRVYQRLGEVKYELLLTLPNHETPLAVSSFNLHRDFYTRVYDVHLADGRFAETGCIGFGLERWTHAFLCQKGLDPARWPLRMAAQIGRAEAS